MQELTASEPTDGRTLRSLRTRDAIVDATIELVESGDLRPTAPRVAERASVSVRSVFQHFDDLESLHASVADRLLARVAQLIQPIDPTLPFTDRLARFVTQRGELLEAVTPIRRAAAVHGPFSTEITARLRDGQAFLRAELETVFAAEVAGPASAASELLDALDMACSWVVWEGLRAGLGRSEVEAAAAMRRTLVALLGPDATTG